MRVIKFISRNKDNKDISNFKQRTQVFIADKDFTTPQKYKEYLRPKFNQFISEGEPGEFCRCYISINNRDSEKTKKALLTKLINEDVNLAKINSVTCSLAAKPENALEHKWLFDFDSEDGKQLGLFLTEISKYTNANFYATPHGYAIITDHGFDTRGLLPEYVTLKRDADLCIMWDKKRKYKGGIMDYKKLYEELSIEYVAMQSANAKLRDALIKSQERIISLEQQLEKYESLDELIESIDE